MNEYDKRWPLRLRGPYQTTDGIRYVVAPNRAGVTVVCPLCDAHVHPGSLVATIAGLEAICMGCRPPGGSRVRAGRKSENEIYRFVVKLPGDIDAWSRGSGNLWLCKALKHPDAGGKIGHLRRVAGGWNGSMAYPTSVGAVDFLIPITVERCLKLTSMPGPLYFRDAEHQLLKMRLQAPKEFNRVQRAARMRLAAWNEGKGLA